MTASQPDRDLSAWMTAYGPGLRRFFRRRVDDADVDDLVQDVFVRLQAAQPNTPIENVEGYLFATARNVLISQHRRRAARPVLVADEWSDGFEPAEMISPERIAIGRQEYMRVLEAILHLPPRAREAFELHRFEHLTYQAIAQRMGITKDSVKELMHRALVRIAEAVEVGA